jgi:hypothetical protein
MAIRPRQGWYRANFKCESTISRRDAPEVCMNLPPMEGVGNAGCPLHP